MKKLITSLTIIFTLLVSCTKPSDEEYQTHCYDCTTTVIKYKKGATYWNNSNIESNQTVEYCNETLEKIRKIEKLTFTNSVLENDITFKNIDGTDLYLLKGDTITTKIETICRYKI